MGLRFHPLVNVTLTQFVFNNQGHADSIVLADTACNVISSISVPASTPTFTASVHWPLTAGTTYWLVDGVGAENSLYGSASFPWASGNLVVESGGYCSDAGSIPYWFSFSDLVTCQ